MTNAHPPRLAVALLRRLLPDHEPLAGDLVEGFAARQSRLWFWRQALLAIAIHGFRRRDGEHPLGLGGHSAFVPAGRDRNAEPRRINLTASPLPGIGGLGLVVLGALVSLVRPGAWWIFVPAMAGGVVFGLTMVLVRRRALLSRPAADGRTLMRDPKRSRRS